MLHYFGFADLEELRFRFDLRAGARTARVPHRDWAGIVVRHGPKHVGKLVFVLRLHMHPVWDVPQIPDVEQAMMGRAVVAAQAGPVHAKTHV